jgi:hypothetical protein
MHYLIKEVTLDPVLMGIAAAHYALAIVVGIWAYHVSERHG